MSRILLLMRPGEASARLAAALAAAGKTPVEAPPGWQDDGLVVDRIHAAHPDVVVVGDGVDGALERCRGLTEAALTRYIPVALLVAARPGEDLIARTFAAGAREILCLEDAMPLLMARVDNLAGLNFLRHTFRRQHDALAARTAELDRVFETVTAGLAIADAEAQIVRVNAAGTAMLGEGAGALTEPSSAVLRLYAPDGRRLPIVEHPLYRAAIEGASTRGARLLLRRSDPPEDRVLVVDAEPLHGAYGELTGGLAVFRDETESVRLHEELAQRNEEMEAFVFTASHDMKSPLQTIRRYARMVREDEAERADVDSLRHLERIEVNAQRLGGLVEGLVHVVKVGRMELMREPCDLNKVVRDAMRPLDALIRQADAQIEVALDLPTVVADHERLVDVFENLVGNAVKYRRPGVPCRVEVGWLPEAGEDVHLFVRDNGMGIAPENHARVFGLFQRLHRRDEIEGSGLGLAIVSRIVERHGGTVRVESALGEGATFHVHLPRREEPSTG
jgi:signal transduction histidine kinase